MSDKYNIYIWKITLWILKQHNVLVSVYNTNSIVYFRPTADSPASRVSKRVLFACFHDVCEHLKVPHLMTLNYAGAKQAAHSYQQAKMAIIQHLKTSGFGQWLSLHEIYGTDTFFEEEKL